MPEPETSDLYRQISETLRDLVNPHDLISGAKLADTLCADNIVVFKRTSAVTMKQPQQGVAHNYHHRFELLVPLERSGRVYIDGASYLLEPGMIYLMFPHQFHHFLDLEDGEVNWLFITFECARRGALEPLRNSPRRFGAGEAAMLRDLMRGYLATAPGPERTFALVFTFSRLLRGLPALREVACRVETRNVEGEGAAQGELLQSINAYVRTHLNRSLSLADLARHTGYSASHLRAVFRGAFGISLGNYMRASRLSLAAAMLSRSHQNLEEIARACGFDSIVAFGRAFKKGTGRSPRAYRRLLAGEETAGSV